MKITQFTLHTVWILGMVLLSGCAGASTPPEPAPASPVSSAETPEPTEPSNPSLPNTPAATVLGTDSLATKTLVPAIRTPTPTEAGSLGPGIAFERTFGGAAMDEGVSVSQTADGGYVLTGLTRSFGAGGEDVFLIRTDPSGSEVWAKTFGGSGLDNGWSVLETPDGGFLIAGFTDSFGAGGVDFYLIRTDSTGELLWEKTYGGEADDYAWAIQPAPEGGYVIAGQTDSFGAGDIDAYLIRIDADGEVLWTQTYGGKQVDRVFSVDQAPGGGFILAGITSSFGAGGRDAYVVKTDSLGKTDWERTFGDIGDDVAHSVDHTEDGGYLVMGYTNSFGAQDYDVYLIKIDFLGDTQWTQLFGGKADDRVITGQQTLDGGYILVGRTRSFGAGNWDMYLVKTDSIGDPQWSHTFGGALDDTGYAIQQTRDGDYVMTGFTRNAGAGLRDVYLLKIENPDATFIFPPAAAKLDCSIITDIAPDSPEGQALAQTLLNTHPDLSQVAGLQFAGIHFISQYEGLTLIQAGFATNFEAAIFAMVAEEGGYRASVVWGGLADSIAELHGALAAALPDAPPELAYCTQPGDWFTDGDADAFYFGPAERALVDFFARLHAREYTQASQLYGGSYEILQGWNPTIDLEDQAALLEAGCTFQVQCLLVQEILEAEQIQPTTIRFLVSFSNEDGTTFTLGPCCGADENEMPPQSVFDYTVELGPDGVYRVLELPVYVP